MLANGQWETWTFILCSHAFFFATVANYTLFVNAVPKFDHFLRWITVLLIPIMVVGIPFMLLPIIYGAALYAGVQLLTCICDDEDESLFEKVFNIIGGSAVCILLVLMVLWPLIYSATIPSPNLLSDFTNFTSSNSTGLNNNDCDYSNDGSCDVPQYCDVGTDCTDCDECGSSSSWPII